MLTAAELIAFSTRIAEHLLLSGVTAAVAVLIALPIGVFFGHTGRGGFLAINVANLGRALPSLALLALMLPVALSLKLGLGFWPTFFALVPLGIPPGKPDEVWLGGSMKYGDIFSANSPSNGRAVQRSIDVARPSPT